MIVSIHQPDYIPWLGLYYKIAHSDLFVYLDNAQYSNEAAHNFNTIKGPSGAQRLKVPVEQHFGDLICNVRTKDELNWKEKHLKTLQMNYSRAPYFKEIFPGYQEILQEHRGAISILNMSINKFICDGFGIHTPIRKSSDMDIKSNKEARVIDICLAVGGTEYLSGTGAKCYQNEQDFSYKGLKLTYLDYQPIIYPQLWGKFVPCLSVLDYIFNCGFDWVSIETKVKEMNG